MTVVIKDYSREAYDLLFKLMYGDIELQSSEYSDTNLLFEVYGLAHKYLVVEEIGKHVNDNK